MTSLPEPYYDRDGITLFCGNAREILPHLPWANDWIVVCDPPYGTGGWRRLASGQGGDPTATLVIEAWDDGAVDWLSLCGCDAALVFWPAARTRELLTAASAHGWTKHRAVYMRKPDPKPQPAGRIKWGIEPIWALSRDGFTLYGGHDLFEASGPRKGRDRAATGHPYEKPVKVMNWLIGMTRRDVIVDPFVGSGTTLVSAYALGKRAIGIEQDPAWCEVAVRRLQQSVLPLEVIPA